MDSLRLIANVCLLLRRVLFQKPGCFTVDGTAQLPEQASRGHIYKLVDISQFADKSGPPRCDRLQTLLHVQGLQYLLAVLGPRQGALRLGIC